VILLKNYKFWKSTKGANKYYKRKFRSKNSWKRRDMDNITNQNSVN